ncbi:3-dehydroquinate synthase family protein [Pseudomonas protegens]|uniref:3-dehydroquinate synthase n=1 Tax=Pseudomonas protegens TaxID=380021 RepID=UPI003806D184
MRASFNINSSAGEYRVSLGEGLVREVLTTQTHRVFLVDSRLMAQVEFISDPIITVDAIEENKSLERIAPVIEALKRHGATRETEIVAVGGGIIQDIATFVASIYMRGLRWHYCPTTLLGMVDSCIGGKSSINVGALKNLVGNFHPPTSILIDLAFVHSLSAEQQTSGLMESVKICYARGEEAFAAYLGLQPAAPLKSETAFAIIKQSLATKKWFIEIDEFDHAERLLLNFGHTFGHAVESATGFAIPHGIAVGVGILMAYRYAQVTAILTHKGEARAASLVAHVQALLQPMRHTLAPLAGVSADELLKHFESDKKHSQSHFRLIVPVGDGDLERLSVERTSVVHTMIGDAFAQGAELAINGGA